MNEKILVVDDEKEIADLVKLYLENEGFQVAVCYDGKEALELMEGKGYHAAGGKRAGAVPENPGEPYLSGDHADGQGGGAGQGHGADPGGGRLHDKTFPAAGAGGKSEGTAAQIQEI